MLVAPVRVGARAVTGAGSVVTEDVPPDTLVAGVPAKVKKSLEGSSSEWVEMAAREYQSLRLKYMGKAGQLANDGKGGA
jgi:serine acetyltransferase